jgi:uncharacterized caspase-like protein
MEFLLGARENELDVKVEYEDPFTVDRRLTDSRVLPVSFEVRNVSARPVAFDYQDVRLNLGGDMSLAPVDPAAVSQEISRTKRVPGLLRFLGNQSTAFHPNLVEAVLEKRRLRDGSIRPGQTKKGLVFFIRPEQSDPSVFNGVMWLETSSRRPQMLETKDISVWTRPPERVDVPTKARRIWNRIFGNTPPAFNKSYALLIGIQKYRHLPALSSPAQDVARMARYLEAQGFDEVVTIKDESVTPDTFRQPQKYLKNKLDRDDRFLFYYSGHGMSVLEGDRPRGYLPLVDEVGDNHTRSIPMDDLVQWMKGLSAQHLLVILDSCFSGLAIEGIELKDGDFKLTDPKVDRDTLNRLSRGTARYLLMAGTAGQQSFGGRNWNGSVFTDTIIKGLQSGADLYHDRIVTTRELYVYVKEVVYREAQKARRELTPLFMDLGPVSEGEFIFVQ